MNTLADYKTMLPIEGQSFRGGYTGDAWLCTSCYCKIASLWKAETPLLRLGKDGKTYKLRADWQYAHAAATLAAYCGLRACEIKGLQWKDVDFGAGLLEIRHSKTPGGWRTPTLNAACSEALTGL